MSACGAGNASPWCNARPKVTAPGSFVSCLSGLAFALQPAALAAAMCP